MRAPYEKSAFYPRAIVVDRARARLPASQKNVLPFLSSQHIEFIQYYNIITVTDH